MISVCIPAYNRAEQLSELLNSILPQPYTNYEIVICEDLSPEREAIREVVKRFQQQSDKIKYFENEANLGYDGNFRRLIEVSSGEYCLFMGNDDLMAENGLSAIANAIGSHKDIGVVLRSYATFDQDPKKINQVFRYFEKEIFFPAGAPSIATVFRRSVVISGMVVHRESAQALATDKYDGTLLYQLYLVGHILALKNAVYTPEIIALYRNGGIPDFGNSASEKGKFVPKEQTPESSIHFMQGMLKIAYDVELDLGMDVYEPILMDIANYAYPIISIQAKRPFRTFLCYCHQLGKLGFYRHKMFYVYVFMLLVFGEKFTNKIIKCIKKQLGHAPVIGSIYQGQ